MLACSHVQLPNAVQKLEIISSTRLGDSRLNFPLRKYRYVICFENVYDSCHQTNTDVWLELYFAHLFRADACYSTFDLK